MLVRQLIDKSSVIAGNAFAVIRKPLTKGAPMSGDRLMLPLELEDGHPPKILSAALYVFSAFIFMSIIWASLAEIREVAHAPGEIAPVGSVQTVQHLEGGIVSQILVREGAIVEKNQLLFRLQPAGFLSDLGQIKSRLARLTFDQIRLAGEIADKLPDFGETGSNFPALAASQIILYRANARARIEEEAVLEARVNQKRTDVNSAAGEFEAIYEQLAAEKEKLHIQEVLLKDGFTSRQLYLNAKGAYHRVVSDKIVRQGRLRAARQALKEAEANLSKSKADTVGRITAEQVKVSAEKAEIEQQIVKLKDRVQRLEVRAPVAGIVKQVVPKSPGAVTGPGDLLAELVPTGQELVAVVKINPSDIGHVKTGDKANIKISTYDPNRHGRLSGIVRTISAASFKNERGEPYFKAILGIEDNDDGHGVMRLALSAGMVVDAEIVTDTKSLTRYLLKPIYRSLDMAFSER